MDTIDLDHEDVGLLISDRALPRSDQQDSTRPGGLIEIVADADSPADQLFAVYGYGATTCGAGNASGVQHMTTQTFRLVSSTRRDLGLLVPTDPLNPTSARTGDSGAPVFNTEGQLTGLVSLTQCQLWTAFQRLGLPRDAGPKAAEVQDLMREIASQECTPSELEDCTAAGAHYCLDLPGAGASCVRYEPAGSCPDGHTAHPTGNFPVRTGQQICVVTPPEPVDPPPQVTETNRIFNDGVGIDVQDAASHTGNPLRYEGASFDRSSATSNDNGYLAFWPIDVPNEGEARGRVLVATSRPMRRGPEGAAASFPGDPTSTFSDATRVWVDGGWSDDLSQIADPVEIEGAGIRYFYGFRYSQQASRLGTVVRLSSDEPFNAIFYNLTSDQWGD